MTHRDRFNPTDRLAHKLASPEIFRENAEVIDIPLVLPVGREAELHQAANMYRDAFFDVGSLALHIMRRTGGIDPSAIAEQRELENRLKASCSPWLQKARESEGR